MGLISQSKLELIKKLYYKEFYSAREIAIKLDVSIDAVYYFMRRNKIIRRNFSEQNKVTFSKKPLSFKIKTKLSREEEKLKNIGTVLYWCEGYKADKASGIDFANSDPKMILMFVNFLRRICGIKESKFRVLLYCYSDQNVKSLVDFWSNLTHIPKAQFSKPYVRGDFRKDKIGKMSHGLVHIRYADKKLLTVLKDWIKEY